MKSLYLVLNLRLFDEANLNVNTTATDTLSAENKTYYQKKLIGLARKKLVHGRFLDKYSIPKNGGKTTEFRKYSKLPKVTTALQEGVTPKGQKMEVTAIIAEVSQYGGYVTLSDMLEMSAIDPNISVATELCGYQSGESIDGITREILNAGTNVLYAPKVAADGTETEVTDRASLDKTAQITVDVVNTAVAYLKAQDTEPIGEANAYMGLIHPYAAYDLRKDPMWIDVNKYAGAEKIFDGEIGKIGGVRFIEASEVKIWKDETCPEGLGVFSTIIMGLHAGAETEIEGLGMEHIVKQKGSGGTSDPLNQRSTVGWKATHTAEILSEEYMIRIESCSARFSEKVEAN